MSMWDVGFGLARANVENATRKNMIWTRTELWKLASWRLYLQITLSCTLFHSLTFSPALPLSLPIYLPIYLCFSLRYSYLMYVRKKSASRGKKYAQYVTLWYQREKFFRVRSIIVFYCCLAYTFPIAHSKKICRDSTPHTSMISKHPSPTHFTDLCNVLDAYILLPFPFSL